MTSKQDGAFRSIGKKPWFSSIIIFAIVFVGMSLLSPKTFLTMNNITNVLRQGSVYAIMAVGMTFAIMIGGIDLSQGSVLAVVGVVVGLIMKEGRGNMYVAMIAGLASGALIGLLNGVIIGYLDVPAFIATLGTMYGMRGVALILTDAAPVGAEYAPFRVLGTGYLLGIPLPVYLVALVAIAGQFILTKTAVGRYILAVGSNAEASHLSGINVRKVKVIAHVYSSVAVAIAAIMYLSRLGAAQPTAGSGYELEAVCATVIGGSSIMGGEGSIVGSAIGAMVVMILRNGMVLLGVSTYWQQLIIGTVLVVAVIFDVVRKKAEARKLH
ncbi:MAG: ABC transporter permease [Eubacteriales bacterium]|nr:ABC transporter permease [Eubacteriales bacterium]